MLLKNNKRHTVKFWGLILVYWLITGMAITSAFKLPLELPDAAEFQQFIQLPLWAVVLAVMSIIQTGLIADVDDDFSLLWVDVALLVLFAAFKWIQHVYLLTYWYMAPTPEGTAILAVWPWVFVILFVFIALASLLRRAGPSAPHIVSEPLR